MRCIQFVVEIGIHSKTAISHGIFLQLQMFFVEAHSKSWPNACFFDSESMSYNGTIHFRYNDVAACLIFISEHSDLSVLSNIYDFSSDLLSPPIRNVKGCCIVDLIYYCEFSIIDDPPRICFHDPVQEFGISFNFKTKEEALDIQQFLRSYLTTEIPNLPGFFRITRFLPSFGPQITKSRKMSSTQPIQLSPVSHDELRNILTLFQQCITPVITNKNQIRPLMNNLDINSMTLGELKQAISNQTLPIPMCFETWLKLLFLPQPHEFKGELLSKYFSVKSQWSTFTKTQLSRSESYRKYISQLTLLIKSVDFPEDLKSANSEFLELVAFNVLMTIGEIDRNYHKYMKSLLDILIVILRLMNPVFSSTTNIKIQSGYEIDQPTFEAIAFWMLLKLMLRGELLRILPLSSTSPSSIFEPLNQYLTKYCPHFYQMLSSMGCFDLSALVPLVSSLFIPSFSYHDILSVLTAALSSRNVHEFFLCMVIVCLLFNKEPMLNDTFPVVTDWISYIWKSIDENGLDFIISASLVFLNKSREMIGAEKA